MSRRRFSDRYGHSRVDDSLQIEDISKSSLNRLWNVLEPYITLDEFGDLSINDKRFYSNLWDRHFKLPLTDLRFKKRGHIRLHLRGVFYGSVWWAVYNLIEALIEYYPNRGQIDVFIHDFNKVLEEERCGHRIIGNLIVPITDETEYQELVTTLSSLFDPIRAHTSKALQLFADRTNPDYPNSIKESISAVECICQIIAEDRNASLGKALKKLISEGVDLNPVLNEGLQKLYGYTNTEDGIRHAMMELDTVDQDDARFMLVICSAFVNYLTVEADKSGINLQANYEALKES